MIDLSLHILDIAENSFMAGAKNVEILVDEDIKKDLLTVEITDDGAGMDKEMIEKIKDPFVTSRKTRRVGLGIPLLESAAELANGEMVIESDTDIGTKVKATFQYSHIDRKPVGNIKETLITLIIGNPEVEIKYVHINDGHTFKFDTKEMKRDLIDFKTNTLGVLSYLEKNLKENTF
jgi:anti-sigma regulatory factor (Ser/Thr protein kinase)